MARGLLAIAAVTLVVGCTTVDPGPNFVVPDESFDADFFFCFVEPQVLTAKKCGPGDPAAGDKANGCHFNASAVSGMALENHDPVDCANGHPTNRSQIGAGGAAQGNLQAVTLEMSKDIDTAPLLLRPTGQNHPRTVFDKNDPVVDILRQWAQKMKTAAALVVALVAMLFAVPALAADGPDAFARVVVDSAELRSGPTISARTIYTAHRGETFAVDGRQGAGYWLSVVLPDGRTAYGIGDEMQVFAVRPGEPDAPSRPGIFASPPLEGTYAGFAILGGILATPVKDKSTQAFGYIEVRPSIVLHRTVTLDGFLGDALTADGSEIIYGGGLTVNFAPSWAICPFLGIGAGGISTRPNTDSFVLKREDLYMARAGAGILMALRGRILVRLEATNMTLFDAESFKNAQTYAGGFGVYF